MKIMMADGKESTLETPTYIVTSDRDNAAKKSSITKKHVVIGVIVVVIIGIILAAILIGVHMFSQAQKDIVKFSLQFKGTNDQDAKQDVESDPNDNVVMTTVTKGDQTAYIINDFNRGIQVVKLVAPDLTTCYVNALNKTLAMDPKYITDSNSMNGKKENAMETFKVSEDPVADRSFLSKKAQDVCKGISLYWVSRVCGQQLPDNSTAGVRDKRSIYYMQPYCNLPGLGGCCAAYWACRVSVTEYVSASGYHTCYWYLTTGTCCGTSPCCNTAYYSYWYTPGLAC